MKKTSGKPLKVSAEPGESTEEATARVILMPCAQAATTLQEWLYIKPAPDLMALAKELSKQSKMVQDGNLSGAEEMLTAQAHTLDVIFNRLAARAINAEYLPQFEANLKLALRAQAQARATWETVSAIQHPPIAGYIKQANVAHNQQINNGSRTREIEKAQSKLLEQTDGNRLEFGATGAASKADSPLEAVDAKHGSEVSSG